MGKVAGAIHVRLVPSVAGTHADLNCQFIGNKTSESHV
jgi:hypothetical protein